MKRTITCGLALFLPLLLASCIVHVHEHPGASVTVGINATPHEYYYYPSSYVYYDPVARVYFYIGASGTWIHGKVLPRSIVIRDDERVMVKLVGKKPYRFWHKHYKQHPPKKRKVSPGQLKQQDQEKARKVVIPRRKHDKLGLQPKKKPGKAKPRADSVLHDTMKRGGEADKGKGKEKQGKVKGKPEDDEEEDTKKEKKGKEDKKEKKQKKDKKK